MQIKNHFNCTRLFRDCKLAIYYVLLFSFESAVLVQKYTSQENSHICVIDRRYYFLLIFYAHITKEENYFYLIPIVKI